MNTKVTALVESLKNTDLKASHDIIAALTSLESYRAPLKGLVITTSESVLQPLVSYTQSSRRTPLDGCWQQSVRPKFSMQTEPYKYVQRRFSYYSEVLQEKP